jgi:hypothetical protein
VYVKPPGGTGGGQPKYLGTAERAPRIRVRPAWHPVFNDIGGDQIPFDVQYMGEEAFISADLTRWDEEVYKSIAHRLGNVRGADNNEAVGTLMLLEGKTHEVYVKFPYTSKAAFAGMPQGYHFVACILEGPDELDPLGTVARKINLMWHAIRKYAGGHWTLYDHEVGGLPDPS